MSEPLSLSEAIGRDHDDFDICYNEIKRATDDATKTKWRNQLTWNVARHAVSEELTWYPAMEKHMGELGRKLTEEDKEQHMSVKTTLYNLQDTPPTSPNFNILLEELMANLHHHIEHEKNEDMPRLENLLSREESQNLAQQFLRTKNLVPTRSHPGAPTSSWAFEGIAALLAAPMDRLRDLVMNEYPGEGELRKAGEKSIL